MQWQRLILLAVFLNLAVTACDSGSDGGGGNGDGGGDDVAQRACGDADENGVVTCTVDATAQDTHVHFDFDSGEVVALSEAEASNSEAWDIAFRRYFLMLNGGASGPGSVGGALSAAQDDFYAEGGEPDASVFTNATPESEYGHLIGELPAVEDWVTDSVTTAFDVGVERGPTTYDYGWYRYDVATGNISANPDNGWLLRSGEGDSYARMRVTAIDFPTRAGNGIQSFEIAFDVQPADTQQFSGTATFTGSIPGEGGEVCFDFDADENVDCTGTVWDLKVAFVGRDFHLRTNSGPSGDGDGGALGPSEWSELSAYPSATTSGDGGSLTSLYVADTTGGIFADSSWYAYGVAGGHLLWPNYRVYTIATDTGDDAAPRYAFQLIDYYDESGETSGTVTFRYRPLSAE